MTTWRSARSINSTASRNRSTRSRLSQNSSPAPRWSLFTYPPPKAELETPARQMIQGDDLPGEDGGVVSDGKAQEQRPDPNPSRASGHSGKDDQTVKTRLL